MKTFKKLALTLLVLFMLVPTFAFAQEVKETPELKAKIQNIVNTMPEDDAIEAIENLFGENDRPHFATRSAETRNFEIYKIPKDDTDKAKGPKLSMANAAFISPSRIYSEDGDIIIELTTTPIYYLLNQADVTKVTIVGKNGNYDGENSDFRDPVTRHYKEKVQVPGKIVITVPETEVLSQSEVPNYNSMLVVKFETNLRDDFALKLGNLFPDAMVNPTAKILFNR